MKNRHTGGWLGMAVLSLLLQACSGAKDDDVEVAEKYIQTFDAIKTDQFVWSYGHGGIYWVSDDAVVLDGVVENEKGLPLRGIYKVSMDGTYTRLAQVNDYPSWDYCFSENTLYLRNSSANFTVFREDPGFTIKTIVRSYKTDDMEYSKLRCKFYRPPKKDAGYIALFEKDGFIKKKYQQGDFISPAFLSDGKGKEHVQLEAGSETLVGEPYFLADRNAYFGYFMRANCASLWWLYRDGWRTETKKQCFGKWAEHTGKVVLSTRVGLFVQHYTTKPYKAYLIADQYEYKIATISIRGGAVSPDGCKVAYASGDYRARKGDTDFRQILKVFNACQFINNQGRNHDNAN